MVLACGHEIIKHLGKGKARQSRIELLSKTSCAMCSAAEIFELIESGKMSHTSWNFIDRQYARANSYINKILL